MWFSLSWQFQGSISYEFALKKVSFLGLISSSSGSTCSSFFSGLFDSVLDGDLSLPSCSDEVLSCRAWTTFNAA